MITDYLLQKFPNEVLSVLETHGDQVAIIRKDHCHEVLQFLREDPQYSFDLLADLAGVDYKGQTPRFELVYQLYSFTHNHRLRIRVKVPEDDMKVLSVIDIWKTADWFEREAYEMFGFTFQNHPCLKKLLLNEEFEGFPLRKDYPIAKRQKIPTPLERP